MARSPAEKIRILLTRVVMGAVGVMLLVSRSAWQDSLLGGALFLAGCVLAGVGTVGRIWAAVYVAGRKTHSLVTTGPYSLCRNPLYFFSLIGGLGVALATKTFTIPALFLFPFAIYYPYVIRSEETRLRETHGAEFEAYCKASPAFWPRLGAFREEKTYEVNAGSFRRNTVDTLWFFWLVGILALVEQLHRLGHLPVRLTLP